MKIFMALWWVLLALGGQAQTPRFCSLHGSVYITNNRAQADFIVYEEDSEAFADFLVYEEENRLYATEEGVWFFVDNPGLADFIIFLAPTKNEADFVIAYTDSPTFAGCN
ncbi:MAG TPA: hypothetical protein ENJ39_01555 [Flammeovirgaceae bacterium]|nr:hypothetical protein [Flammeovirgaceae bacterium]